MVAVILASSTATAHAAPPTAAPGDGDAQAARTRVVTQGRRMITIGSAVSIAGSVTTIAMSFAQPPSKHATLSLAVIGSGLAVAVIGLGVAFGGLHRSRHPERYMPRAKLAAAPWGSRHGGGLALSLRF